MTTQRVGTPLPITDTFSSTLKGHHLLGELLARNDARSQVACGPRGREDAGARLRMKQSGLDAGCERTKQRQERNDF